MHGLDERNAPAFRRHGRDLAGQPVVRVQQVIAAGREVGLGPQHPEGERADLAGQGVLVEFLERAGHHVADEHAGYQLHRGRRFRADRAGEDLDLDAAAGQLLGHLDHVDVEAARVAGARLVERRGVHADGRDPPGADPSSGATHHLMHVHKQPRQAAACSQARLCAMSELEGRGVAWTEERGTSDEGRRRQ